MELILIISKQEIFIYGRKVMLQIVNDKQIPTKSALFFTKWLIFLYKTIKIE
jgi:hypothetical protein